MILPLIIAGAAGAAALGAYVQSWLSSPDDVWADKDTFNARMRDMQQAALALNTALANCKKFMADPNQLASWRIARDGFSKFYGDVGTLNYFDPSAPQIAQAKDYASKFAYWAHAYDGYKCGTAITPTDPNNGGVIPSPDDNTLAWTLGGTLLGVLGMVYLLAPRPKSNPRRRRRQNARPYSRRRRRHVW